MLAEAFLDDPVMHWMQPVRSRRPAMLGRLFAVQLRQEYLPAGGVQMIGDTAGQPLAAAIWKAPATTGSGGSRWARLATTGAVVAALGTRLPAALTVRGALERAHPEEPHWYLNKLGTTPGSPGPGFGLGPAQRPNASL